MQSSTNRETYPGFGNYFLFRMEEQHDDHVAKRSDNIVVQCSYEPTIIPV